MDYKRFGKAYGWSADIRFTVHDKEGWALPGRASATRSGAKRQALMHGVDGTWIKDNINTAFVYQISQGRIRRMRVRLAKQKASALPV